MKPILEFNTEEIRRSSVGKESAFPDIMQGLNVQNKTAFELEEDDEIYEGYGKLEHVFPYRQIACYSRELEKKEVKTAVLENDFLRAVFLPELGGRLWRLTDKKTGKELLYTNDVIRPSNLATRNAWFSGGVEWNIGIIGHTPLTMEPLFTAKLDPDGEEGRDYPVLRMYEYERIRKVTYQMDFWLEEDCKFLNCRMRIMNDNAEVIPMYWWSNMAVPEYEGGRILLSAKEAYSSDLSRVYKVSVPYVDGVDITKYNDIPNQIDYFFHIQEKERKYIANIDKEGYGLLHISSSRLQSRKLFSWGHNDASHRWQEFLTDKAGDYVEIQAGLGKTQYGCIPMAPHTAWEWIEQYGAVQAMPELSVCEFEEAEKKIHAIVERVYKELQPEEQLKETKNMAKSRAEMVYQGSGYGELENLCRQKQGEKPMSAHLDFSNTDSRQKEWKELIQSGILQAPSPTERPADFMKEDIFFELLESCADDKGTDDKNNWYVRYQLGLNYLYRKDWEKAEQEFKMSDVMTPNSWAKHGKAVCLAKKGIKAEAVSQMQGALENHLSELSMVKDGLALLLKLEAYEEIIQIYKELPEDIKKESRIYFGYIRALAKTGEKKRAYELLMENDGLEIVDFRECECSMEEFWQELCQEVFGDADMPIPHKFNYNSL